MTETLKHFIAGQVRVFRKQRRMRQAGLAEAIGRTPEAISNIERAKSLPALDTLIAIAAALEVPIRAFFPDDGVTEDKSPNRLRLDAEGAAILRSLSDERAKIAIGQLRAMAEA